ncbi:MAG: glycosyltransferase [Verrucomicrobia bacterium]|nr:glycosyltransferase [Verrucomicrobiota bacterium]
MRLVVLGLSITSSWGNGHATTYRALLSALNELGCDILFLERDLPWYAANRDAPNLPFCRIELYQDREDLRLRFGETIRSADAVLVGSYVPDGVAVGELVNATAEGVTAFYDIDTPVTLAKLQRGDDEYLSRKLIRKYNVYFSFTGGPILDQLERKYGSPAARPLYCSADDRFYYPESLPERWALGYLGTYSPDRQNGVEQFLIAPALCLPLQEFVAAGPSYPKTISWPPNVRRIDHLPPDQHRKFYCAQKFTLNLTRADMRRAGYSPSVRLFEAAACGVPIISDRWDGIETFFNDRREILLVRSTREVVQLLRELPDQEREMIGARAREKVMREHSAKRRAEEFLASLAEAKKQFRAIA